MCGEAVLERVVNAALVDVADCHGGTPGLACHGGGEQPDGAGTEDERCGARGRLRAVDGVNCD